MSKFLTGVLIGFAAGMLLAPDTGEHTREQLSDTADKWKRKVDKLLGNTEAELDDLRLYLDKHINGLSENTRQRILALIDEAEDAVYGV